MAHSCDTRVQKQKHAWHQTMHVHACIINAPHTHTLIHTKYLPQNDPSYNQQYLKLYNLHMQIYSWWNSYRYTGKHETYCICNPYSQLGMYVAHTYNYSQLYSCNLCTTFCHFRLVQEAEQKALILLLDMVWTTISYSQGIKIAIVYSYAVARQVATQLMYSYSQTINKVNTEI